MTKECASCMRPIRDGQEVIAIVLAAFHEIPSDVSFAIAKPTHCYEVHHRSCGEDWLSVDVLEAKDE